VTTSKTSDPRLDPTAERPPRDQVGPRLKPADSAETPESAKQSPRAPIREGIALLNSAQVASLLGISQRTVCLWAELDEIPGFKLGHQWRFQEEALREWLQSHFAQPK